MDIVAEIEKGLQKPGKSKSGLAKALNRHPNVVTYILKRERRVALEELPVIREYLEMDATVPVVGSVSAGSEAHFYGEASDDPAEAVPAPQGATQDTVAVEIRGDSLGPGLNGWLAFYEDRRDPVSEHQLNNLCVVGLPDGRVLIKILKAARQRGRFHLFPNGPGEPILDVKVDWAAVVTLMGRKS